MKQELIDLAPSRIFLICKAKNGKMAIIDEIICYLKSQHLTRKEENIPAFEAIIDYLKTFLKSVKEDENI